MTNQSDLPLYKTTHWRRLKTILNSIIKMENIDSSKYNLDKITCYQTVGVEMQGSNVKFHRSNASIWVTNNHYDIYEVPMIGKEFQVQGEYLFLAHNTDFDYWMCGKMEYKIEKESSRRAGYLVDRAEFFPFGTYDIITSGRQFNVTKKKLGKECDFGYRNPSGDFDGVGARKLAYRTTASKLLAKIIGRKQHYNSLKGAEAVKIYKNHKKKK